MGWMHDTFQSQMTEAHVGIHTEEERHDTKTASNDIYIIWSPISIFPTVLFGNCIVSTDLGSITQRIVTGFELGIYSKDYKTSNQCSSCHPGFSPSPEISLTPSHWLIFSHTFVCWMWTRDYSFGSFKSGNSTHTTHYSSQQQRKKCHYSLLMPPSRSLASNQLRFTLCESKRFGPSSPTFPHTDDEAECPSCSSSTVVPVMGCARVLTLTRETCDSQ